MNKEKLKVGDLITAYTKGYWRIKVVDMSYGSPKGCVTLDKILNESGTSPSGRRDSSCNLLYCAKVDEAFVNKQFEEELATATKKRDTLLKYLKEQEND